jgi:hypothetical protein
VFRRRYLVTKRLTEEEYDLIIRLFTFSYAQYVGLLENILIQEIGVEILKDLHVSAPLYRITLFYEIPTLLCMHACIHARLHV